MCVCDGSQLTQVQNHFLFLKGFFSIVSTQEAVRM